MNLIADRPNPTWTLPRLRQHFWMIPAERILLTPLPGTATEDDVVWMNERGYRLCELVEGTLIGKTMGAWESFLAIQLVQYLVGFVKRENLGVVLGADGFLRLEPGLIRAPDVSFISWERLGDEFPKEATPGLAPNLAVEVISKHNTKQEMERKLEEYFDKGVQLVWLVYPKSRTVDVYTSARKKRRVQHHQTLDGGDVLPGFTLPLKQLFASPKRPRRGK